MISWDDIEDGGGRQIDAFAQWLHLWWPRLCGGVIVTGGILLVLARLCEWTG